MNTLFDMPHTRARRDDPDTSHKAAEQIMPVRLTVRENVRLYAEGMGAAGFTDQDVCEFFPRYGGSTLRTRRDELAKENIILDSGRRRVNDKGRETIVWVHRSHHPSPPPQIAPGDVISKADTIVALRARVKALEYAVDRALIVHETDTDFSSTAGAMAEILKEVSKK